MMKRVLTTCLMIGVMSLSLLAQQKPAAPPAAATKPQPAPPAVEVKRRNVSIEVAIADQTGSADPVKNVVTMIVGDGRTGSVRSSGSVMTTLDGVRGAPTAVERRNVTLNVDANPTIQTDGSVLVLLTLEYTPRPEGEKSEGPAQLNERITLTVESGKPMVVSRAADPGGNRKISIELTATVMK